MHSCNIKPCLAFTTVYHPIPPSRLNISMFKQAQLTTDIKHMFAYTYPARHFHAPLSRVLDISSTLDILQHLNTTNTCQLLYSLHNFNVANVFTLNVE